MKAEILNHLESPQELEKLYRNQRQQFKTSFDELYPEIQGHAAAQFWYQRLHYTQDEIRWGAPREIWFVLLLSALAGLVAKIPDLFALDPEFFYSRNIAFIVFPFLSAYFIWKQQLNIRYIIFSVIVFLFSAVYINMLPGDDTSNSLILACIHLALLLWFVMGINFSGIKLKDTHIRMQFLSYNGDLLVMMALIMIAGGIMTGITIGLFSLIDIAIEDIYFKYVAIWGLCAVPIVSTYLVRSNLQLVSKVSPVIAKVFTPLVLIMLTIYLGAVVLNGKDPYNDREFLIVFNALLIGVMALILFSVAESSKNTQSKATLLMLGALSCITLIINGIALSAILFRISEWGITPNRLAVLGSNLIILTHLALVAYQMFKALRQNLGTEPVNRAIADFLPVYFVWACLVTFLLPLLFGFR
jgi:hypothetical protein